MKPHSTPRRQKGMTLVELMVALFLGIFIIGAALMVFQSTSGIGKQISEVAQIRQEGAHAFRVIGKQIREAGSVEPTYQADTNSYGFAPPTWVSGTAIGPWSPPTGTDYLSMSQQVPSTAVYTDLLRNCLGETVTSGGTTPTNRSNFYINGKNLMCATGSNNGQPVADNVNAFKVRYRIRNSETTKQFVTTPSDWSLVDAVEVCLDFVGTKLAPTASSNYTNCDGSTVPRGDRVHVVQRNLFTVFTAQR